MKTLDELIHDNDYIVTMRNEEITGKDLKAAIRSEIAKQIRHAAIDRSIADQQADPINRCWNHNGQVG